MKCDSCEMLAINGVPCHETGCPDTWRTETRECRWCGSEYVPDNQWQQCCDEDCGQSYFNL